MSVEVPGSPPVPAGPASPDQVAKLHCILALSMSMTEHAAEDEILDRASAAVPGLIDGSETLGFYCLTEHSWKNLTPSLLRDSGMRRSLTHQITSMGLAGGPLGGAGRWAYAFPLRSILEDLGFMVVGGPMPPAPDDHFLLVALAQQTGVALTNARMIYREFRSTADLMKTNAALAGTVADLQRTMEIHRRLDQVAASGGGQQALAATLHELTGFTVAVEDRFGNVRAWAPATAAREPSELGRPAREKLLRQMTETLRSERAGGRLYALAAAGGSDATGLISLLDAERQAGKLETVALEHAATVLAMELARLSSTAEAELRMRRDVIEDLLHGSDDEEALIQRAHALGIDLEQPHRVVLVTPVPARERPERDGSALHVVRRVASETGAGALLAGRDGAVVLIAAETADWPGFRAAIRGDLGDTCSIGVGGRCEGPADYRRSYREARLVVALQANAGWGRDLTWDQLGIYGILANLDDIGELERFMRDQIGALMEYDSLKGTNLVETLYEYLESGCSYNGASEALSIHRSTLKYRLERIREVNDCDPADPATRFNLQLATRAWQVQKAFGRLDPPAQ